MSVEQNQQLLASIQSNNPDVMNAAATVNQYTEMVKSGEMSREEYIELMLDMHRQIGSIV